MRSEMVHSDRSHEVDCVFKAVWSRQGAETVSKMAACGRVVATLRCVTVEPVLFFFMFASFLTFSAFMAMTYDKCCLTLYNSSLCEALDNATLAAGLKGQEDRLQDLSSAWIMRSNVAMAVPATLSLLLWMGSWGDRVGRRLPLVVPCVAAVAYSICNLLNAVYLDSSPVYLLIGPVCSGLGGSYLAVLMASYTYLTHLAETGSRMMRVGVAEAAVFLSSTISVFVSGRLIDTLGYAPVFGIALACQVLAILYVLLVVPDIKPVVQDSSCCQGVCLAPLRDTWTFLTTRRPQRVRLHLALWIVVLDILQLCTTGENDILLLYLKRSPRSWSYTTYGYFKGSENFTRGAAVLLLLPLLKKCSSVRDTTLVLAGLLSKLSGLVLLGLARETWTVFLVVVLACLQGFPSAGIRSLLSCLVQKEEQGRLFGLVASTESVVSLTSTLLFNGIYPKTLSFYDGFCLQLAAFLILVCILIVVFQHVDLKRRESRGDPAQGSGDEDLTKHTQSSSESPQSSSVHL